MQSPRIDALVLAAGRSLRAGGSNKLLLPWQDKFVVEHAVDAVLLSHVTTVHVVSGHDHSSLQAVLKSRNLNWIHNSHYQNGISSSISAGVRQLSADVDGVLLCLGDMPWVSEQQINEVIEGFQPDSVRVACFGKRRGHPALFPRAWFKKLMQLSGDDLARCLFDNLASSVVEVPMTNDAVLRGVNCKEDLLQSTA
ncbi:MAG: nucleotidyltransferase family protein [Proteobacteria bacterium]|jgi:molybdenum cofactor cytidylyltransferase|nr:nucleotidyltransferase family protein [Pseudomonadota bacterium]MBT4357544.1 nucleotidyltransferase family protein [Pseudomonadota bacterium]MBT5189401.1 nucleotidyltransferase family protein [Pseudomonadota bacterium]MBT5625166.1 nucleotidyltransferase family protein [Pseudomonadota bacterium]MBT6066100.1 nucleotidyltransferase family protein [Pseudomonadota bacterium]